MSELEIFHRLTRVRTTHGVDRLGRRWLERIQVHYFSIARHPG